MTDRLKIGQEVLIHGYVDEIRKDIVIIKNEGGYFGTVPNEIKALEQEPKTGHWIRCLIRNEKGGCIGAKMICSECGNDNKHDEYMIYCPNCGAKMDERREVRDKE